MVKWYDLVIDLNMYRTRSKVAALS